MQNFKKAIVLIIINLSYKQKDMKRLKVIITFLTITLSMNLLAQDFSKLNEIKLIDSLSCSIAQKDVIECCDYLLTNPCVENIPSINAMKFIINWMGATPIYSFSLEDNIYKAIKSDMYLTGRYYAILAKTAIENDYTENSMDLQLKTITALIEYCEQTQNKVKITNKIQKYIDAKHTNSLKELIVVK